MMLVDVTALVNNIIAMEASEELAEMVVEGADINPMTRSASIQNGDVTRDMIEQMLTLLNGGIPVKSNGCNCGPGEPHTCMTPADSRSPLRGTSRAQSYIAGFADVLEETAERIREKIERVGTPAVP